MTEALDNLAWEKMDGLIPAVVQDASTGQVLMLAYMNREALAAMLERGNAVFYSRSKGRLWEKGESSGNRLAVRDIQADCDGDALLIRAEPEGPTCHLGTTSCFGASGPHDIGFLATLRRIVRSRAESDSPTSYTARLLAEGNTRVAQKLGEEGLELALAAVARDREACIDEAADLVYHLTVLMEARAFGWDEVAEALRRRHES